MPSASDAPRRSSVSYHVTLSGPNDLETLRVARTAMKYLSTRGGDERLTFEEAVLQGLAPNGGLYVPESIPAPVSYTHLTLPTKA